MIKKCCFVISPIGQEGTAIRGHADDVLEFIIQPALKKFKEKFNIEIDTVRADHIEQTGGITKQMFDEILKADLCVAILTGHNPNVFYELAVAQAAARPVIMLIEIRTVSPLRRQRPALCPIRTAAGHPSCTGSLRHRGVRKGAEHPRGRLGQPRSLRGLRLRASTQIRTTAAAHDEDGAHRFAPCRARQGLRIAVRWEATSSACDW